MPASHESDLVLNDSVDPFDPTFHASLPPDEFSGFHKLTTLIDIQAAATFFPRVLALQGCDNPFSSILTKTVFWCHSFLFLKAQKSQHH